MLALATIAFLKGRMHHVAVHLAVGTTVFAVTVTAFMFPKMDDSLAARRLAKAIHSHAADDRDIIVMGYREPSIVFYSPNGRVSRPHRGEEGLIAHVQSKPALCVIAEKATKRLSPETLAMLKPVEHIRAFMPSRMKWQEWTLFVPVDLDATEAGEPIEP